ncbi:MAG TPA: hypothetical protein VHG91_19165 [Longimicrobium sp.]|nr:hypothetical protein [Longimicrobium sp.]
MPENKRPDQPDTPSKGPLARRAMKRSGNRCVLVVDSELVRPYLSLPQPWAPVAIRDWSQLEEAVPAAAPSCCILVDPFAHGPAPLLEFLARFPSATVVAASRLAPGRIVDLRRMLHAGVSDLVDLSESWPVELLGQVLEDTLARPLKRRIEGLLSRYSLSTPGRSFTPPRRSQ